MEDVVVGVRVAGKTEADDGICSRTLAHVLHLAREEEEEFVGVPRVRLGRKVQHAQRKRRREREIEVVGQRRGFLARGLACNYDVVGVVLVGPTTRLNCFVCARILVSNQPTFCFSWDSLRCALNLDSSPAHH